MTWVLVKSNRWTDSEEFMREYDMVEEILGYTLTSTITTARPDSTWLQDQAIRIKLSGIKTFQVEKW